MEKDNRNSSEDILTRFSLLTDDVNVNSIKGWPYINLGEFFSKGLSRNVFSFEIRHKY